MNNSNYWTKLLFWAAFTSSNIERNGIIEPRVRTSDRAEKIDRSIINSNLILDFFDTCLNIDERIPIKPGLELYMWSKIHFNNINY